MRIKTIWSRFPKLVPTRNVPDDEPKRTEIMTMITVTTIMTIVDIMMTLITISDL